MTSSSAIVHITPDKDSLSIIETKIMCEEKGCKKVVSHSSALRLHYIQCHQLTTLKALHKDEKIEKWYHCPDESCVYHESKNSKGKHFSKSKYVKQHYLKVHAERNISCYVCGKSFSAQSFLTAHLNSCGLDLKCSTCKRQFSSIESLQVHLKRFNGHFSEVVSRAREKNLSKKLGKPYSISEKSHSRRLSFKPILPKPEPTYVVAAIALSEMAVAGIKRPITTDVGIQTDPMPNKRFHRKFSSPCRASETKSRKTKQTTEMETQTRLTNLKKKVRKRIKSGSTSTSHIKPSQTLGLQVSTPLRSYLTKSTDIDSSIFEFSKDNCNSQDKCYSEVISYCEEFDCNFNRSYLNTLGTQTSPRATFKYSNLNKEYNPTNTNPIHYFKEDSPSIVKSSSSGNLGSFLEINDEIILKNVNTKSTEFCQKDLSSSDLSSPLIIDDDDDNILPVNATDVNDLFEASSSRCSKPPLIQIRSSSIETQTDHDVFLSTNVDGYDDDDCILGSAQTQRDKDGSSYDENSSLWCSIETQTCEDFSDIEQYLCSTIHTQTQENASELFPELNLTDTQTQTNMDGSPSFVTTHTQTYFRF